MTAGIIFDVEGAELSDSAFDGICRVVADGENFFGCGKGYAGDILSNPTWSEILAQANAQASVTRDLHHVFLEGVYPHDDQCEKGVTRLKLFLGS